MAHRSPQVRARVPADDNEGWSPHKQRLVANGVELFDIPSPPAPLPYISLPDDPPLLTTPQSTMSTLDPTAAPNGTAFNNSTAPPEDPPNRSISPRDHLSPTPSGTTPHARITSPTPPTASVLASQPPPPAPSSKRKGKAKETVPAADVLSKRDHYVSFQICMTCIHS